MNESDASDGTGSDEGSNGSQRETDDQSSLEDEPLAAGVITIATDRTLESDGAGEAIVAELEDAGHEIATREHIDADHDRIQSIVSRMIDRDDVDLIVTGGATSVEPDDMTVEAVEPLLDKQLTAFSELFTALGYEAVGSHIVVARTLAGVADGVPVFCLPGEKGAARLGMEKIILPEAHNLIQIACVEQDENDSIVDEGTSGDEEDDRDEREAGIEDGEE